MRKTLAASLRCAAQWLDEARTGEDPRARLAAIVCAQDALTVALRDALFEAHTSLAEETTP